MRLTREQLLEKYPSWNENKHDIVKVQYGDEPLIVYDEEAYNNYYKLENSTLKNLECASAYMYSQNGKYYEYRTLIGSVFINDNDEIMCGSINVKYYGRTYSIHLNKMYGLNSMDIIYCGGKVSGWCNQNGIGSPSLQCNTKELDKDTILKVLDIDKVSDYGNSVKRFIKECKEIYEMNEENWILTKCWGRD